MTIWTTPHDQSNLARLQSRVTRAIEELTKRNARKVCDRNCVRCNFLVTNETSKYEHNSFHFTSTQPHGVRSGLTGARVSTSLASPARISRQCYLVTSAVVLFDLSIECIHDSSPKITHKHKDAEVSKHCRSLLNNARFLLAALGIQTTNMFLTAVALRHYMLIKL
jgi:hypothetical protein